LINKETSEASDSSKNSSKGGFITAFSRNLLKAKWLILIVLLAMGGLSVPGIFKIDVTVKIEDFFLKDDPILKNQKRARKLFNNHDFVAVLLQADDVFSRESLELIKKVGDQLKKDVPLGTDLVSLIHGKSSNFKDYPMKFKNGKLIGHRGTINAFKKYSNNSSSVKGVLVSADNKEAWIKLNLKPYPKSKDWKGKLKPIFAVGKAAYDTVSSIRSPKATLIASGVPVYAFRKESEMMQDLMKILVFGVAVALFLTIFIFRNIQGVAGTISVIGLSVATVFGIEGWIGISMDSAFIAVPILLAMGVTIGYTVHITRFFKINFNATGKRKESVFYALEKTSKPILFTAFTTIVALLSFLLVEVKPIQWVGITSALCIFSVYSFSMLLYPIFLSFGKDKEPANENKLKNDFLVNRLEILAPKLLKYRVLFGILFIVICGTFVFGLSKITVDFNAQKMMGTKMPHMKDQMKIIKSDIAVSEMIDLVISFPDKKLLEPKVLKNLVILENEIKKLPLVKKVKSLGGIMKDANYYVHGYERGYNVVPSNKNFLKLFMNFYKKRYKEFFLSWVTDDYKETRVFIQLTDFSSLTIENNIKKIDALVQKYFPKKSQHFYSGSTYQMAVMNQYITRGLIQSVLTALLMITILMIVVFRSFKLGLAAMIPNVFPVLVAGGIMGFFEIPLEFVTMTVAPMIMGLAVDDTIHLVSHLKDELDEGFDFLESLRRTLSVVGTAITETTIILCITFLIFSFSKVNSIVNMGIMTCSGILAAYLADIFITPIIINALNYSKSKNKKQQERI